MLVIDRPGIGFDDLVRLVSADGWLSENQRVLILQGSEEHNVYLVRILDPTEDGIFDEWPPAMIPTSQVTIYAMDYRNRGFAVRVVREIARGVGVLVDTNFGDVVQGAQLAESQLAPY